MIYNITNLPTLVPITSSDSFSRDLSIALGLVSIAIAIYLGISGIIRDFLLETKKSHIDEKIAMLYNYALGIEGWKKQNLNMNFLIERMESDVNSIGRIRKSIKDDQLLRVIKARDALLAEMKSNTLYDEANRIEQVFKAYYLW